MRGLELVDGSSVDPRRTIIPICFGNPEGDDIIQWGSAFTVIGPVNVFLTARHIFEDLDRVASVDDSGLLRWKGKGRIFGIWFEEPNEPEVKYFYRDVQQVWRHEQYDLAFGRFRPMRNLKTGEMLKDVGPLWDLRTPEEGDNIGTYAYPELRGDRSIDMLRQAFRKLKVGTGKVTKVYPNGRDSTMLPGPCFESSLSLLGGMSGGPVFNHEGNLCGINSTGMSLGEGDKPISMVSLLSPAMDMELPISRGGKIISLKEIGRKGFIQIKD